MLRRTVTKPKRILAVGLSLTTVLLGLSVVVLSLRKLRLTLEVNQDKDLHAARDSGDARWNRLQATASRRRAP